MKLDNNRVGLTLGLFAASLHALWSILIALIPGLLQNFIDWVLDLHRIKPSYTLLPFDGLSTILLVTVTFLLGYALGWLISAFWNWTGKK